MQPTPIGDTKKSVVPNFRYSIKLPFQSAAERLEPLARRYDFVTPIIAEARRPMTIPEPVGLPALVAELHEAVDQVYTRVVTDEIDPDFIELYVKPRQTGMDQSFLAYRAEVTERGASVSVTDAGGGVYLLPLPAVPLTSESRRSVIALIEHLLSPHAEAKAIEESARTGGCELVLRFDTGPDRFTLVRRRPSRSPDILGILAMPDAG